MYIKQCGNCRDGWGSTPQLISSTSLVALVYLYWGSLCNPIDRKNVKNTNFSCQHMGLLKLKMHQNPFSDPGARWGTYDAPPPVDWGGGHFLPIPLPLDVFGVLISLVPRFCCLRLIHWCQNLKAKSKAEAATLKAKAWTFEAKARSQGQGEDTQPYSHSRT